MAGLPAISFSLALAGLDAGDLRADLERASDAGYRAVQLNAASPACRPRDFDRSARRDLAAVLRRLELRTSGVDLWIPSRHFTDPAHVDRAVQSVIEAAAFAGELATLTQGEAVLSVMLPAHDAIPGELATMTAAAERHACRLADHRWPPQTTEHLHVGLDPATVMIAAPDVSASSALASVHGRIATARLSDLDEAARVEPGHGRLNLLAYLVTTTTCPHLRDVVVDLRGIPRPWDSAARILEASSDLLRTP